MYRKGVGCISDSVLGVSVKRSDVYREADIWMGKDAAAGDGHTCCSQEKSVRGTCIMWRVKIQEQKSR